MPSSGGRKPIRTSAGGRSVVGSMDWKVAVTTPVLVFSPSSIRTLKVRPL